MTNRTDKSGKGQPIIIPGREALSKPLPKRFYAAVEVGAPDAATGYPVLLDGRTARTPGRRELRLPAKPLALAVAAEWEAQRTAIDPATMPLTRLVNTAIDGVSQRMSDVAADIAKYAGNDLLCYRAEFPAGLVARQRQLWDPVLAWLAECHDVSLAVGAGLMPITQSDDAKRRIAAALEPIDAFRLTALHVMTTLSGSAVLALAILGGRLTPEAAWEAAHVDEDWQIKEWGEDTEAAARRNHRWQEMQAAAALTRLLGK